MDRYLTEIYMRFLCDALREQKVELKGRGEMVYTARLHHTDKNDGFKSELKVADLSPRSLSFRLADIIKYHREKHWIAPSFIVSGEGAGVSVTDDITVGSGVHLGDLARNTAASIAIFLEKYLIKG